ncbi:MAG: hypothetical protein NVSMB1_14330 [Polyangiales bacterium]
MSASLRVQRAALSTVPPSRLGARVVSALCDFLPLIILAGAVVFVSVLVLEPQGLPRLRALERDSEQVEAENRALEREIARLRNQVHLLKDDLAATERVARAELGLIRKNEIILQVPGAAAGLGTSTKTP